MDNDIRRLWPFDAKAAIFDFDGTLANTAGLWHEVDVAFLERRGLPYDSEYPQRLSALGFVEGARYTIERFGLSESVEDICAEWTAMSSAMYRERVRLRAGAADYVHALREACVPCALATTNNSTVLGSLEHVDVGTLFDQCVYGADVGRSKDHPDIFVEAARRLGVAPRDCMVFEDIPPAIRSAASVGMTTCAVRAHDASQPTDELRAISDLWLNSWRDIPL